jgi:Mg-chelatase subunit ChlI
MPDYYKDAVRLLKRLHGADLYTEEDIEEAMRNFELTRKEQASMPQAPVVPNRRSEMLDKAERILTRLQDEQVAAAVQPVR